MTMAQPGRKRRDEELEPSTTEEVSAVEDATLDDVEEAEEQETKPAPPRDGKGVTLVLVGAGSYTSPGNGLGTIRKGHPFEVNATTAKELLRTGLFREA